MNEFAVNSKYRLLKKNYKTYPHSTGNYAKTLQLCWLGSG